MLVMDKAFGTSSHDEHKNYPSLIQRTSADKRNDKLMSIIYAENVHH